MKKPICEEYEINVVVKSYDGILVVKFVNKSCDYEFVVCACYLPPENSTRGRDSEGVYSHLLAQVYLNSDIIFSG